MSSDENNQSKLVQLKSRRGEIISKLNSANDNLYTEGVSDREKRILQRDIELIKEELKKIDLEIRIEKKAT